MQKIFINKTTNMVDQILSITESENYPDDYYDWCYAVLDENDEIKTYDLKYDPDTKTFEKVSDYVEPEVVIHPSDYDVLKDNFKKLESDNARLSAELELTQNALNEMLMNTMSMKGGE